MDDFFQVLETRRREIGLSLEDIYERTRINPEFLEALESGKFDVLPDAYIRLFLKKYAQEVGLNSREILEKYEAQRTPSKSSVDPILPSARRNQTSSPFLYISLGLGFAVAIAFWSYGHLAPTEDAPDRDGVQSVDTGSPPAIEIRPQEKDLPSQIETRSRPETKSDGPPVATTAHTIGLDDGPSMANDTSPSDLEEARQQDFSQLVSVENELPLSSQIPPALQSTNFREVSPAFEPTHGLIESRERVVEAYSLPVGPVFLERDSVLTLTGRTKEPTEVFVVADGKEVFSGTLPAGRQSSWSARDRFLVEVQNASALSLSLQGLPLESQNPSSRKRRLFISRSSIWVEEMDISPPQSLNR